MLQRMHALAEFIARYCAVIAGLCLMAIVVVTTLNIVARKFTAPILGAHEATEYLGALLIGLTLAYNQLRRENISVELVDTLLSPRARALMESVTSILSLLVCLLIAWRCVVYAIELRETREVSMTMGIAFYPFVLIVGASFALLAFALLVDSLRAVGEVRK
ncbi:MAG TPA: TRAP transporter small permease [Hyphomicrobiaceae bacterium]|jgi:TRAP-type C4-dicarboxylate transport system permease small subunit